MYSPSPADTGPIKSLTIIASPTGHQSLHAQALAAGVAHHGVAAKVQKGSEGQPKTHHVACWGWRTGERLRGQGHEVLVMERGYVGDRFKWTSLGWNGLNGRGKFPERLDPSRFTSHFGGLLKPWKAEGEGAYILLIGQVPGDASLAGTNMARWYRDAAATAARTYKLPVLFRPHPLALKHGYGSDTLTGCKTNKGSLADAFSGAAMVVTYNSNTGVEAVLAGLPTVATDAGSMAYPVAGHSVDARVTPDRAEWAARLAWCQWTMDEIKSGAAWEAVGPQ